MKTALKPSNKNSFSILFQPRKLFIMLLFFGFTLLIYALSASGNNISNLKSRLLQINVKYFVFTDQIDKEFSSLIENDTLLICKESHKDFRQFVNVLSNQESAINNKLTEIPSQRENLPRIYFVTPTYLRFVLDEEKLELFIEEFLIFLGGSRLRNLRDWVKH